MHRGTRIGTEDGIPRAINFLINRGKVSHETLLATAISIEFERRNEYLSILTSVPVTILQAKLFAELKAQNLRYIHNVMLLPKDFFLLLVSLPL